LLRSRLHPGASGLKPWNVVEGIRYIQPLETTLPFRGEAAQGQRDAEDLRFQGINEVRKGRGE